MRLIDADAYRAILGTMWDKSCDNIVRSVLCECMMQLHSVPTIDAAEVVHGRWEKEPPYTSLGGEYKKALICSECHSFFVSDGNKPWQLHNYCPNCGAKMAKGENHAID